MAKRRILMSPIHLLALYLVAIVYDAMIPTFLSSFNCYYQFSAFSSDCKHFWSNGSSMTSYKGSQGIIILAAAHIQGSGGSSFHHLNDRRKKTKLIPLHLANEHGTDVSTCKMVTFIRHAEGIHNRDEREIENFVTDKIYMHPRYKDADLTDHGRKQSEALADAHFHLDYHKESEICAAEEKNKPRSVCDERKMVELVAVSPLTRTLRTASIAFKHHLGNVRLIATELARERIAHYPMDERRHVEELKKDFPHVDFSLVETNHDARWTERKEIHPDPYDSHLCYQRGLELLEWVHERQENHVAVVSHWVFLQHLFKMMEVNLTKPIGNAEVKRFYLCKNNPGSGKENE